MIGYFVFGNRSSRDYALYISGDGTYDAPERDYDEIEIPGRSGNLILDNHRYKNITVKYDAFIKDDFDVNFAGFRSYLLSCTGYKRLEDTYHPDEYRMALYKGPLQPDVGAFLREGSFTVEFNCKPQRFLKSGEKIHSFTEDGSLLNPTDFSSRPVIRVYGAGTFSIAGQIVTVAVHPYEYIDVDCEMMDAYYESNNANGYVRVWDTDFPVLYAGKNAVTVGECKKIQIIPRWWIL